jgi:predicted glutamine amidotransferase
MWAMNWCFCHNGHVPLFEDHPDTVLGCNELCGERMYYPVGDTDSEATFCAILNALKAQFPDTMPSLPDLHEALAELCREIVEYNPTETILNFFLTCGPHVLWVYSWPGRRPGSAVWNGLYYTVRSNLTSLADADYKVSVVPEEVNGNSNNINSKEQEDQEERNRQVCIVATKPLTDDEEWIELKPGELILMDSGMPHVTVKDLFRVEMQGHGLDNQGKVLRPVRLEEDMRRYEFKEEFYASSGI